MNRGDVEMPLLTGVFDQEEVLRIHLETLVKERTEELTKQINDQKKQAEAWKKQAEVERLNTVECLNTIVENSLDLGADRATIIRQLVRRGHLDETTAETFLNAYQSASVRS